MFALRRNLTMVLQQLFASASTLTKSVQCWCYGRLNRIKFELALPFRIFSRSRYMLTSPLELCYDFFPRLYGHFVTCNNWVVSILRGEGGLRIFAPFYILTLMITQCEYITSSHLSVLPWRKQRPDFEWIYMTVINSLRTCRVKASHVGRTKYLTAATVEIFRPEDVVGSELISLVNNFDNFFLISCYWWKHRPLGKYWLELWFTRWTAFDHYLYMILVLWGHLIQPILMDIRLVEMNEIGVGLLLFLGIGIVIDIRRLRPLLCYIRITS